MFFHWTLGAALGLFLGLVACGAQAAGSMWKTHPDQNYRAEGVKAYQAREYTAALQNFLKSAEYADKGSQAMIAELFWFGLGTEPDRALAYVWADIAAERGYPVLIAKREGYWAALDAAEKARVDELGPKYYAIYGDAVAKPRLERILRSADRKRVGSRVGGPSNVVVLEVEGYSPLGNTFLTSRDSKVFDSRHWKPREYWEAQDLAWNSVVPPQGTVQVLPVVPDESVD